MKAERLLELYERVADAPDAVEKLRRFVLDLAVRGKLVEQDAGEEPASELLKRIAAEKARLVKAGEIKRADANDAEVSEPPYIIPDGWEWSTISTLAYVEMGQSPPSEHYNQEGNGVPFFQGKTDFGPRHPTPRYWCTQPTKMAKPGDILISVRAPVGPTNVAAESCCIGRGLAALRPYTGLDREFMLRALTAFEAELEAMGFGTTFVAINKKQLTQFPFPLPPLAEQRRIVAKVEELMALLDRLEETRKAREATRDRLTAASLSRLTAAPSVQGNEEDAADETANSDSDANAFRTHAQFALDALPSLTTRPDQIKPLRQAILDLAVRGKLVEQDPRDEPAAYQLERIEECRLLESKGARSVEDVRTSSVDHDGAELPTGWASVCLEDVSVSMRYGTSIKCGHDSSQIPVLRIPNVSSGKISLDDMKFGPLEERDRRALALQAGDLLLIRSNGSLEIVGRAAVVTERAEGMSFAGYLVRLKTLREQVNTQYVWLALQSRSVRIQIELPIRSAVGLKNINLTEFGRLSFWLPPLAEQHRIVAKVDELMSLCDQLEASLEASDQTRASLLDAVLREALSGAETADEQGHEEAKPPMPKARSAVA